MKLIPPEEHARRYSHFNNELELHKKDHTKLYLGIALGILITFCLGVYVVTSIIEVLNMPIV